MGLPVANLELHAQAPRVDPDCFNIESEIEYWKMHAFAFDLPPSGTPSALYVDLIRFSYDCYLLLGKRTFDEAEALIKVRLSIHPLRFQCHWRHVSPVIRAVWGRMASARP